METSEKPDTLEYLRPIRVSDHPRVALQIGPAMVLAYGVARVMNWHRPYWAGLAVAFCGLGSIGESSFNPNSTGEFGED